jgi:lysozyme
MAFSRNEKVLLALLGGAGILYLLSRTETGQAVTGSLLDKIASVIGGHEGYKLTIYPDEGGLPTVGRGHLVLSTDTVIRNGVPTKLSPYGPVTTITPAEADAFFERDTEAARNTVANKVATPISENQRAALVSLVFNIGAGAFATSTLLRKLNTGDLSGAADQFLVWKKVRGVDSPGLLSRRQSERALFLS